MPCHLLISLHSSRANVMPYWYGAQWPYSDIFHCHVNAAVQPRTRSWGAWRQVFLKIPNVPKASWWELHGLNVQQPGTVMSPAWNILWIEMSWNELKGWMSPPNAFRMNKTALLVMGLTLFTNRFLIENVGLSKSELTRFNIVVWIQWALTWHGLWSGCEFDLETFAR